MTNEFLNKLWCHEGNSKWWSLLRSE